MIRMQASSEHDRSRGGASVSFAVDSAAQFAAAATATSDEAAAAAHHPDGGGGVSPAAAANMLPRGTGGTHHTVAFDAEEALPASAFDDAADDALLLDPDFTASILRNRSSAAVDSAAEFANPLSRAASGISVLRRSGTSLGPDGAAFAAIDMPPLSRQPSLIDGDAADAAAAAAGGASRSGSRAGSSRGGSGPPSSQSGADTACFGRMRPSVGIALSALCFIAAVSILSAWLPAAVHDRASIALRSVLPANGTAHLFQRRQDVVIVFKEVSKRPSCCQQQLGNHRPAITMQNLHLIESRGGVLQSFNFDTCSAFVALNAAPADVLLQGSTLLADLHMMCGRTHAGAQRPVLRHPVSPSCNLANACSHVFGSVLHGIAGRFTK